MKVAVISDIHGNLAALQAVLQDIEGEHVDLIVNLGDILSGPLLPAQTADFLMARDIPTIAGNHERQLLKLLELPASAIDPATSDGYGALHITDAHAAWLRSLPTQQWLTPDVLLVHGTPGSDLAYWLETVSPQGLRPATGGEVAQRLASGPDVRAASLVLCGHTHVPRAIRSGPTLIVNPGSVGLQAYEDSQPHPHRTENGAPDARYAVVERRLSGWTASLRTVPYDWAAASRQAAEHGRPDWAYALATGYVLPSGPTLHP